MSYPGGGEPPDGQPPSDPYGQPSYPPPPSGQPAYPPPPAYGQPSYPPPPPAYGQPSYPPPGQSPYPPGAPYGGYPAAPPTGYGYGYGYGYPVPPVPGGQLAGMGARLGGLVLDAVILGIPLLVIAAVAGAFKTKQSCDAFGSCTTSFDASSAWIVDLLGLALGLAYSALLVGLQGQTIGHRAAGIRVVDVNTGGLIGPGRAAGRWFVLSVTGAICTLGYWSPFFDSTRRQGWHDKAVSSVVIPNRPNLH